MKAEREGEAVVITHRKSCGCEEVVTEAVEVTSDGFVHVPLSHKRYHSPLSAPADCARQVEKGGRLAT
jgi:hypothetical protein